MFVNLSNKIHKQNQHSLQYLTQADSSKKQCFFHEEEEEDPLLLFSPIHVSTTFQCIFAGLMHPVFSNLD